MAFQNTVNFDNAYGLPGEFAYTGPRRAEPGFTDSATPANNVFGRVFSELSTKPGYWRAGNPDNVTSNIRFAIMVNPKEHVAYGTTAGGTLAPTMVLPNGVISTFMTEGDVWALSTTAALTGQEVIFAQATGIISTQATGATPGAGFQRLPTATVARDPGNANGVFGLRMIA